MSRQTRNIYVSGNAEMDRILADIAARLDTMEGLRPALDSGLMEIDADKKIGTSQPLGGYQRVVSGVNIAANSVGVEGIIEVYDSTGELIHKME